MADLKPLHRRLYGYMCVFLLLQEFHVVILAEHIRTKKLAGHPNDNGKRRSNTVRDYLVGADKIERQPTDIYTRSKTYHESEANEINLNVGKRVINDEDHISVTPTNITRTRRDAETYTHRVHHRLKLLSEDLKRIQKTDFVAKANSYITDCSHDHFKDIEDFGNSKSPSGIITMVILAMVYILAGCGHKANEILSNIMDEVGEETVLDMLQTIHEMVDDIEKGSSSSTSETDDAGEVDDEDSVTEEENAFLSDLLAENILNTSEMLKLFDMLAKGETFVNETDVETLMSEFDQFSLQELIDRPNYKWITYPSSSDANTSSLYGSGIQHVIQSLNSNSTQRLIREMTVPVTMDSKTTLLIIFDRQSHRLLSVTDDEQLILSNYGETELQNQLWVLDGGQVINVGFKLALHTVANGTVTYPLTLEKPKEKSKWRTYKGRLAYGYNVDCFLMTGSSVPMNHTVDVSNITVDCGIDLNDVNIHIASFKDANTAEKLVMLVDKPLSLFETFLHRISNSKLLIFTYMLNYMVTSSLPGYTPAKPSAPQMLKLESTFFIKNSDKPCKVLSSKNNGDSYISVFEDFSENTMEFQLWYWKDNQIVNVGTQAILETNNMGDSDLKISRYFRLWVLDNGRLTVLNNNSCELIVHDFSNEFSVLCGSIVSSGSLEQRWTFVQFDKPHFNNFVDVVCMYFVQSAMWPCELMTAPEDTAHPIMSPFSENMFSQLWYMSNGRFVNAGMGFAIADNKLTGTVGFQELNATNSTTWYMKSGQIISEHNEQSTITLNTERNGTLSVMKNDHLKTQIWKFLPVRNVTEDSNALTCEDTVSEEFDPFVIRNDKIPACQLLTMVNQNETAILQMKHFDETILDFHLWVMYRGLLINVKSGLSLEPTIEEHSVGRRDIKLVELHAFQQRQMWSFDDSGTIRWKLNPKCFLDFNMTSFAQEGQLFLNCDDSKGIHSSWSLTKLPTNEQDLADTLNYMCFYFIRSRHEPCQYITANLIDGSINLRPLVPNLLERQLWYWNERYVYLAITGQYLNESSVEKSINGVQWLTLTTEETETFSQWAFLKNRLLLVQSGKSVSMYNDGRLLLSDKTADGLDLEFVNYDTYLEDATGISCSVPLTEETEFFFIRSHLSDCLVLTGANLGQRPVFKYFDQDNIEAQLWFTVNNTILNVKTNFALHADVKTRVEGSHVVMQEYYKYAVEQNWKFSGNTIFYGDLNCVLDIDVSSNDVIVWCNAHGGDNQQWDTIDFDGDGTYLEELTCIFFLRHEVIPCELLTHVGNSIVQLRPATEEFFNNQLWYWSGEHILNAASGLAVDVSYSRQIVLRNKVKDKASQKWKEDGHKIVSASYAIGLEPGTGKIKLLEQNSAVYNYIKWKSIDLDSGLNDQTLLNCESALDNPTIYYIRSDKDPCHVLSEHSGGQVSMRKVGKKNGNQAWIKIRKHIVNAFSGKVLSVNYFYNGQQVRTSARFEHEIKQHWKQVGSSVQITSSAESKLLDVYDDVCIWKKDDSDGQKWVWLNANDVEKDTKLLRCSNCYNKKEEKANEVMQYIPIFGWLYSLIRAPVYAAKGCPDVALESLMEFGIGVVMDIAMAVVTVLTCGTASAAAYGVKTAVQSGVKAGIKAAVKAATTSIKLALRQAVNAGKVMLKQGLKKTVLSLSKTGLKSIKHTFKSNLRTIKSLPSATKSFVVQTGKSLKRVPTKVYNAVRSTSYGSFKSSVKNGLRKLPSNLKKKLNKIGNSLANKAESKIKRLDDIKKNKPTGHIRCKRTGKCHLPKKTKPKPNNGNLPNPSAFVPNPDKQVKEQFDTLLNTAKQDVNLDGLQNAHFGLSTKKLHSKTNAKLDEDSIESMVLRDVKEAPYDKNYNRITDTAKEPQSHTEQALLKNIDDTIRKKCGGKNCELYLWTKNSPCMQNTYKLASGNTVNAKSCFTMLVELCYRHVKNTKGFKMCHIGFRDFYKGQSKGFMDELTNLKQTRELLHPGSASEITEAAINNMQSFIKFYQIAT